MQTKLNEIQKNNEDRRMLFKENKLLAKNIKHGKARKGFSRVASNVGKATGRGLFKVGAGAFKGLQRYGNFLAEQERKQQSINRRLKSKRRSMKRQKKVVKRAGRKPSGRTITLNIRT